MGGGGGSGLMISLGINSREKFTSGQMENIPNSPVRVLSE